MDSNEQLRAIFKIVEGMEVRGAIGLLEMAKQYLTRTKVNLIDLEGIFEELG